MPSFIWGRDPQEAYQNPYEYEAQEQFIREATSILDKIFGILMSDMYQFTRDDTSLEKAIYMLHLDSIDSLRDGISLIRDKKHRIASRVLRDVLENVSLCNYFYFDKSEKCKKDLLKWYNDVSVNHSVYRKSLEKRFGETVSLNAKKHYYQLSKITHRTYKTLAYGYSLGSNNRLIYEGKYSGEFLVLPQTVAMYLTVFADLIQLVVNEIKLNELISEEAISKCLIESYENEQVKRRFTNAEAIFSGEIE